MKKVFSVLILTVLFACKSSGGGDRYTINGKLENANGKKVVLEQLNMRQVVAIDSGTVDESGKFKLSSYADKGFYRLRVENTGWFILLENEDYTFSANLQEPIKYEIKGTDAVTEMDKAVKDIMKTQEELKALNEAFYAKQNAGASMDSLQAFALGIQARGVAFEKELTEKTANAKDAFVALYYMSFLPMQNYPNEAKTVIARLEKEYPNSSYTKEMKAAYTELELQLKAQQEEEARAARTDIGAEAPELEYEAPDGSKIKLSSLRGKVVLLDFWASWCGPCRRENPAVVAAYKKYKDKGFAIYSVSLDQDKTKWVNAIAQDGLTWKEHVSDLKGWKSQAAATYGVSSIPAQFLLDKNGIIIAKNLRGQELDRMLAEVLK